MDILNVFNEDELKEYVSSNIFESFAISINDFEICDDLAPKMSMYELLEKIRLHNNSVHSLKVTYAFCKHYYNLGINDGDDYSVDEIKYFSSMNNANKQNRIWFCYFAEVYYLKLSSIMEFFLKVMSVYLNFYIEYDVNFKHNFKNKLKIERNDLKKILDNYYNDDISIKARKFRNSVAHDVFKGYVNETVLQKKDEKKIEITFSKGVYEKAQDIINNMEEYTVLSGRLIKNILTNM